MQGKVEKMKNIVVWPRITERMCLLRKKYKLTVTDIVVRNSPSNIHSSVAADNALDIYSTDNAKCIHLEPLCTTYIPLLSVYSARK